MDNEQKLANYISHQLQQGQVPDVISNQLLQAGWPQDQINQAFLVVQAQTLPTTMQTQVVSNNAPPPLAEGKKRGRIRVGWQLLKHCISLLNGNRYLLRYFFMTWVLIIAIEAALITFVLISFPSFYDSGFRKYTLFFVSYLLIYFVINFYAAALARNILDIYGGGTKNYKEYIRAARARAWPIFVYTLIWSVIGIIIEYIIEKLGWLGRILAWMLGTAWSLATMFTLPIIMDTPSSAPSAIRQSWGLFKETWGEGITAKTTVGGPIAIIQVCLALVFWPLLFSVAAYTGSALIIYGLFFAYIFVAISLAVIGSYASNFINAALYYYAVKKQVPPGFTADMLNHIFIKSKRQLKKEARAPS